MSDLPNTVKLIYHITGPAMSLAYLPQIYRVYRDRNGAKTISIPTWGMWTISLAVTTLYSYMVALDDLFFISSILSFSGCFLVLLMTIIRRIQHRRI